MNPAVILLFAALAAPHIEASHPKSNSAPADVPTKSLSLSSDLKDAHNYRNILLFNRYATLGSNKDCERTLNKILKHNPEFSSAPVVSYLLTTNQFQEAADAAERYRKHYGHQDWDVNLSAARALSALKKDDLAEKMFAEASKTAQRSWAQEQTAYAQAVFYIQNNKFAHALTQIDQFLEKNTPRSKHALFYFLKATIHLNGLYPNHEAALAELNKGLDLNPQFDRALKLKALVLEQQNKKDELVPVLKRIIEMDPQAALSKRLVSLLFELGRLDEAYVTLAQLQETTADFQYDLALLSWKLKQNHRALNHINEAIKLKSEFARARLLKLEILFTSDQKAEALNHLRNWIKSDKDSKTFSLLGMLINNKIIAPQDAINVLESLHDATHHRKEVLSFLGDLYTISENYKLAEKSYKTFIKHLAKSDKQLGAKALYNLGFVAWKQGNIKEALAEVSKAHSIAPNNPLITNVLAFLYTQQEDKQKRQRAKDLFQMAQTHQEPLAPQTHLTSLLSAQARAYTFSPFWSHLDEVATTPEQPKLDFISTTTIKSAQSQTSQEQEVPTS